TPVAGFVNQANQTLPAVTAGTTQTVTFVNTRTPPPPTTGSVAVVKQAPADARNVVFSFSIDCPGTPGTPFIRTVTGSGTTATVDFVRTGTVCTAQELPMAGWVVQPAQAFPGVVTNATQFVSFINRRVSDPPPPPPDGRGFIVICKAQTRGVSGTFRFTVARKRVSVAAGRCSGAISVPLGTVKVRELGRLGFAVCNCTTTPTVRLVSCDRAHRTARVRVLSGGVANQTTVIFTNKVIWTPAAQPLL
ncbi:MAG: hypothetical protein LC713_06945, partial [Actinobacteria bacterium]|nr:hypothetical protein [Actinomycetota bacterium]